MTTEQARDSIWKAIGDWRGPNDEKGPYRFAKIAGVSASMLYQFARKGGPHLGPASINALAPLLPGIERGCWLAAMGIQTPEPSATEAQA